MTNRTLDELDLKLLQALQLDGRAPFNRIAAVLGVSDQTVARRFRKLRATVGLRVLGMTDELRLGRSSWLVRMQCTPDAAEKLADALARRADTSYVALISGGTEVVCSMKPRNRADRDELLLDRLQRTPRVIGLNAYCILHRFYGDRLGWLGKASALTPAEESALRPGPVEPPPGTATVDAVDEVLLAALFHDGRATIAQLQSESGHSEDVVHRRLERLRAEGVLYYGVQYSPELMGHDVGAMLWLTVAPAALSTVGRALAGHREVEFAAASTGRVNIVAAVRCRGTEELYAYLTDRIGALDGVLMVESALILRQIKQLALSGVPSGGRAGY
ncbi:Lrp/AsnC family transcriptional regulator [Winogradskya humida]|uniref:Transcriptional regulator n=1 Tax=Winogradskya humida TaxID=113566 RepID=A0ABQ4A4P2_9ACTN|nr:Lrp/AsnC family transcriptional regulator [Actinoplanes humidus]GIE25812.1 transcriptional regulator [Actinoplanes humidus]